MTRPLEIPPVDELNQTLVANVHPPDWVNPTPSGRYNLVVIGAGTAGLITAAIASSLGAKVALVERHLMGGDCLNVGCVPSKAVIRAARMVSEARAAVGLGLHLRDDATPDFAEAMRRMRAIRARISHEDSARRYTDEFGVEIFLGHARFTTSDTVDVDGTSLRFKKAVIATGARAALPAVDGLAEAEPLTNETIFELTERPRRLGVIGAGPIGCELAQSFQRLGSQVTLFERDEQILTREDRDAAEIVQRRFARDGVEMLLGCQLSKVERSGDTRAVHVVCAEGGERRVEVDQILVGAGRAPNVEGLGLETVGVDFDPRRGVRVDDRLRTTHPRIFAAGDVAMDWKFTHAADAAAKIVVQNALFLRRLKLSSLVMPWCTYTDPEIAHVGLYAGQARERGIEIDTWRFGLEKIDRAIADGEDEGFVKVHVRKGKDEILGGTIVASHAGEMISQLTLAITQKIGLGRFTDVIYPYPTQAEVIKRAAGAYTRTRLTPGVARLFERWLAWTR